MGVEIAVGSVVGEAVAADKVGVGVAMEAGVGVVVGVAVGVGVVVGVAVGVGVVMAVAVGPPHASPVITSAASKVISMRLFMLFTQLS